MYDLDRHIDALGYNRGVAAPFSALAALAAYRGRQRVARRPVMGRGALCDLRRDFFLGTISDAEMACPAAEMDTFLTGIVWLFLAALAVLALVLLPRVL